MSEALRRVLPPSGIRNRTGNEGLSAEACTFLDAGCYIGGRTPAGRRVGTEANVANSFHVPAFRESLHRGFDRSLVAAC